MFRSKSLLCCRQAALLSSNLSTKQNNVSWRVRYNLENKLLFGNLWETQKERKIRLRQTEKQVNLKNSSTKHKKNQTASYEVLTTHPILCYPNRSSNHIVDHCENISIRRSLSDNSLCSSSNFIFEEGISKNSKQNKINSRAYSSLSSIFTNSSSFRSVHNGKRNIINTISSDSFFRSTFQISGSYIKIRGRSGVVKSVLQCATLIRTLHNSTEIRSKNDDSILKNEGEQKKEGTSQQSSSTNLPALVNPSKTCADIVPLNVITLDASESNPSTLEENVKRLPPLKSEHKVEQFRSNPKVAKNENLGVNSHIILKQEQKKTQSEVKNFKNKGKTVYLVTPVGSKENLKIGKNQRLAILRKVTKVSYTSRTKKARPTFVPPMCTVKSESGINDKHPSFDSTALSEIAKPILPNNEKSAPKSDPMRLIMKIKAWKSAKSKYYLKQKTTLDHKGYDWMKDTQRFEHSYYPQKSSPPLNHCTNFMRNIHRAGGTTFTDQNFGHDKRSVDYFARKNKLNFTHNGVEYINFKKGGRPVRKENNFKKKDKTNKNKTLGNYFRSELESIIHGHSKHRGNEDAKPNYFSKSPLVYKRSYFKESGKSDIGVKKLDFDTFIRSKYPYKLRSIKKSDVHETARKNDNKNHKYTVHSSSPLYAFKDAQNKKKRTSTLSSVISTKKIWKQNEKGNISLKFPSTISSDYFNNSKNNPASYAMDKLMSYSRMFNNKTVRFNAKESDYSLSENLSLKHGTDLSRGKETKDYNKHSARELFFDRKNVFSDVDNWKKNYSGIENTASEVDNTVNKKEVVQSKSLPLVIKKEQSKNVEDLKIISRVAEKLGHFTSVASMKFQKHTTNPELSTRIQDPETKNRYIKNEIKAKIKRERLSSQLEKSVKDQEPTEQKKWSPEFKRHHQNRLKTSLRNLPKKESNVKEIINTRKKFGDIYKKDVGDLSDLDEANAKHIRYFGKKLPTKNTESEFNFWEDKKNRVSLDRVVRSETRLLTKLTSLAENFISMVRSDSWQSEEGVKKEDNPGILKTFSHQSQRDVEMWEKSKELVNNSEKRNVEKKFKKFNRGSSNLDVNIVNSLMTKNVPENSVDFVTKIESSVKNDNKKKPPPIESIKEKQMDEKKICTEKNNPNNPEIKKVLEELIGTSRSNLHSNRSEEVVECESTEEYIKKDLPEVKSNYLNENTNHNLNENNFKSVRSVKSSLKNIRDIMNKEDEKLNVTDKWSKEISEVKVCKEVKNVVSANSKINKNNHESPKEIQGKPDPSVRISTSLKSAETSMNETLEFSPSKRFILEHFRNRNHVGNDPLGLLENKIKTSVINVDLGKKNIEDKVKSMMPKDSKADKKELERKDLHKQNENKRITEEFANNKSEVLELRTRDVFGNFPKASVIQRKSGDEDSEKSKVLKPIPEPSKQIIKPLKESTSVIQNIKTDKERKIENRSILKAFEQELVERSKRILKLSPSPIEKVSGLEVRYREKKDLQKGEDIANALFHLGKQGKIQEVIERSVKNDEKSLKAIQDSVYETEHQRKVSKQVGVWIESIKEMQVKRELLNQNLIDKVRGLYQDRSKTQEFSKDKTQEFKPKKEIEALKHFEKLATELVVVGSKLCDDSNSINEGSKSQENMDNSGNREKLVTQKEKKTDVMGDKLVTEMRKLSGDDIPGIKRKDIHGKQQKDIPEKQQKYIPSEQQKESKKNILNITKIEYILPKIKETKQKHLFSDIISADEERKDATGEGTNLSLKMNPQKSKEEKIDVISDIETGRSSLTNMFSEWMKDVKSKANYVPDTKEIPESVSENKMETKEKKGRSVPNSLYDNAAFKFRERWNKKGTNETFKKGINDELFNRMNKYENLKKEAKKIKSEVLLHHEKSDDCKEVFESKEDQRENRIPSTRVPSSIPVIGEDTPKQENLFLAMKYRSHALPYMKLKKDSRIEAGKEKSTDQCIKIKNSITKSSKNLKSEDNSNKEVSDSSKFKIWSKKISSSCSCVEDTFQEVKKGKGNSGPFIYNRYSRISRLPELRKFVDSVQNKRIANKAEEFEDDVEDLVKKAGVLNVVLKSKEGVERSAVIDSIKVQLYPEENALYNSLIGITKLNTELMSLSPVQFRDAFIEFNKTLNNIGSEKELENFKPVSFNFGPLSLTVEPKKSSDSVVVNSLNISMGKARQFSNSELEKIRNLIKFPLNFSSPSHFFASLKPCRNKLKCFQYMSGFPQKWQPKLDYSTYSRFAKSPLDKNNFNSMLLNDPVNPEVKEAEMFGCVFQVENVDSVPKPKKTPTQKKTNILVESNLLEQDKTTKKSKSVKKGKEDLDKSILEKVLIDPVANVLEFPLFNTEKFNLVYKVPDDGIINIDYDIVVGTPQFSKFPSVSRILNATMSEKARAALEKWKERMIAELGEEGFEKLNKAQLQRGSDFHKCVKLQMLGKSLSDVTSISESVSHCLDSVTDVLKRVKNVSVVESHVTHPHLPYKGIVDCVAEYDGIPAIIEWKHSEKRKASIVSTFDAPVQMSAYLGAVNYDPTYSIPVECGVVVVAYTDGSPADVFFLPRSKCEKYWKVWLTRLNQYLKMTPPSHK